MNILHISTQDVGGGGGSYTACYRLHQNLIKTGINSKVLVLRKTLDDPNIVTVDTALFRRLSLASIKLNRILLRGIVKNHQFTFKLNPLMNFIPLSKVIKMTFKPDVIVVHWISDFMTPRHLYELNRLTHAPILWYLLDMAPLTGGCHYAFDCTGYVYKCGNCPALRFGGANDWSHLQWKMKDKYLEQTDMTIVSASSWLTDKTRQSSLFSKSKVEQIMLGIDTDIFRPVSKTHARELLDIPGNKKVIFFGAQALFEERKGMNYLIEAFTILNSFLNDNEELKKDIFVVMAGKKESSRSIEIPFTHKDIGFLENDYRLALAYQAADIFVCPSTEDAGPMMINESILCGTPVVSFEMGVAFDLVHTGVSGYRAKIKDSTDLARGIKYILSLSPGETKNMSERCKSLGLRLCNPKVQVKLFVDLFKLLLERNKN